MASVGHAVNDAVLRLASRTPPRTENDIQSDIYLVLTVADLGLDKDDVARTEVPTADGTRKRLDIEIGHCVIEVKKDLRTGNVQSDAEQQLAGYVQDQQAKLGSRYVGILTDGTTWSLSRLRDGVLERVDELKLNETTPDVDGLLLWLESVLATRPAIPPTPEEIKRRLGSKTPAYRLDHSTLAELYQFHSTDPEITVKRDLWAKLLRTAFGEDFKNTDDLFIDHTLLVIIAKIVAHAAVGFDVSPHGGLTAQSLVNGAEFRAAQINGVVEEDFFDWVVEVPGGQEFVIDLARRISRFDWSQVEHDVLKILYESVIPADDRRQLGEYYTPDWLADRMVDHVVTDPLNERVLDCAAGSGTFVFHAVRAYLAAAEAAGMTNTTAIEQVTQHVIGMDVHPVAVIVCRVTYLLAIGRDRISDPDHPPITIPVYLGDAVQWEQRHDVLDSVDEIRISTSGIDLVQGGGTLYEDDLVFPRAVLADAARFDQLVTELADVARDSTKKEQDLIRAARTVIKRYAILGDAATVVENTFRTMRDLHKTGRNHVWGYYVRNLIRPLWLAEPDNRVDVCVGNPPWLRYSRMREAMQERYKKLAGDRNLLTGGLGASARDLSTLFVVRTTELYLRPGGRFAWVMPHGTLTRRPHTGFRSGDWSGGPGHQIKVAFETPWDLSHVSTGFPNLACVVIGQASTSATPLGTEVGRFSGELPRVDVSWPVASQHITIDDANVTVLSTNDDLPVSEYKARFRNGAILYPRMLMFVDRDTSSPLGPGKGRVRVTSHRSSQEKEPWKFMDGLSGTVERIFVRNVLMGESIAPYRQLDPLQAVLPVGQTAMLTAEQIEQHSKLASWWNEAETLWETGRKPSESLSLRERIDFHSQLSAQLPTAPHRVVYTASGVNFAAARVRDDDAIIEHKLYWAAAESVGEARYLTAILNSQILRERVQRFQAKGLYGERDFDKHIFYIPIPLYNADALTHQLAELAEHAETVAAAVELPEKAGFKRKRTLIEQALVADGVAKKIENAVGTLIPVELADEAAEAIAAG